MKAALRIFGRIKSQGVDGILIELFQVKENEFVKLLRRICQQIWKIKERLTDWKCSRIGIARYTFQSLRKEIPRHAVTIGPLL